MLRVQGCTGAVYVQDVLNAASAGMHRSSVCTGYTSAIRSGRMLQIPRSSVKVP